MHSITIIASVIIVGSILFALNSESMYDYYTYVVPMKNSEIEYVVADYHHNPINVESEFYGALNTVVLLEDGTVKANFLPKKDWTFFANTSDFNYTSYLNVGDSFVVGCLQHSLEEYKNKPHLKPTNYPTLDVLKYLGTDVKDEQTAFKFYHVTSLLESDMPCDYDKIIEYSFDAFKDKIEESNKTQMHSDPLINPEKDLPIFFEVMLMEQDIVWEMPQREWNNPDIKLEPPARFCSEILLQNGTTVFLSTVLQPPSCYLI